MQKLIAPVATFAVLVSSAVAAEDPQLSIAAETPHVEIARLQTARRGITLPDLEIRFLIDARCPESEVPLSLMLSIADSRHHVPAVEIGAVLASGLSVSVPARQMAPVFMHDFCTDASEQRAAMVPDLLSAQGSLTCGRENEAPNSVKYASTGVDVSLSCSAIAGPPEPDTVPEGELVDF